MAKCYSRSMAASVTLPQNQLLDRLLKSGRWNNKSEIIRHGLELIQRELEEQELSPYPDSVLSDAYRQLKRKDWDTDAKLGRASARPATGELD